MKLIYTTTLLLAAQILLGQMSSVRLEKLIETGSKRDLVQANTDFLIQGNWYQASLVADKLLQMEPENANFNYRKGRSMMALTSDPTASLPYLIKGATAVKKKFDALSPNEKSSPFDVYYYLGKCYHLNGDLNLAEENYQKFLSTEKDKRNVLRRYASLGIEQVANARRELAAPRNYTIKNLGGVVNSVSPDFSSVIALDGSSLYYTSRRLWSNGGNADEKDLYMNLHWEDIYVSYKDNGTWGAPQILDFCTPDNNQASVSISKDERQVYTYNDKTGNGDIYVSNFIKGEFKSLERLNIARINTAAWEPHFVMSPDGNTIYFVSDREGGYGGRDIYRLERDGNGEWSKTPINMGPEINSEFDEDSPFISFDGQTLYFSTNGAKSTGGFDIMKSTRNSDGSWTAPSNMGYPLNSTGDDVFFTTVASGQMGYFTSYRKGGYGDKDIYEVALVDEKVEQVALLRGVVRNADNSPLPADINARLICKNCDAAGDVELLPRLRDGVLIAPLEKCKDYELVYYDRATEIHRESFSTTCTPEFQQIDKEHVLGGTPVAAAKEYYIIGTVVDDRTGKPIQGATVKMTSLSGQATDKVYSSDADGKFRANVLGGYAFGNEVSISYKIEKDGYLIQNFDKSFKLGADEVVNLNFRLAPVESGLLNVAIELKPIYYDLDKADIRDDAAIELDKVVKIMNDNPNLVIEIGSHTDCRHTAQYNMALSQRRAVEAVKYVRARITNPNRISGKGYGETQLVNNCACECDKNVNQIGVPAFRECEDAQIPNCSEQQHQMNRRTEFKIVSSAGAGSNVNVKPNPQNVAPANSNLIDANGFYTVQEGDTVYSIMRATGVPVETIIRLNNLTNPDVIKAGQRLKMR
jgi:outer membrane protein OmpA-like peptidoglycan-associated protein/tetratricopeptide (TPR) repeat protein